MMDLGPRFLSKIISVVKRGGEMSIQPYPNAFLASQVKKQDEMEC